MNFHSILALLRIELGQIFRERSRFRLIGLLIAIPVACLVCLGTIVNLVEPTSDELVRHSLGSADIAIEGVDPQDRLLLAKQLIGADSLCARIYRGNDEISIPGRTLAVSVIAIDTNEGDGLGIANGMLTLQGGRLPRNSGEVAVSSALLLELNRTLGDEVNLFYGPRRWIVGIVLDSEDTKAFFVVRTHSLVELGGKQTLIAKLSSSSDRSSTLQRLQDQGFPLITEEDIRKDADQWTLGFIFVGSCLAFFLASLIIGAAYAISIKRRQREFGLVSSIGANPLHWMFAMMISTLLVSLVSSLLGAIIGVALASVAHPFLDHLRSRLNGPFELSIFTLLGAISMGGITTLCAVLVPAWRGAQMNIRDALQGSRPEHRSSNRWWIAGALLVCGITVLHWFPAIEVMLMGSARLLIKPILFVVGLMLLSPWLLRFSSSLTLVGPIAWRLALSETARYRGRNSVAVVAVFTSMSVSVVIAILTASLQKTFDQFPSKLRDDQLMISGPGAAEVIAEILKKHALYAVAPLTAAFQNGQPLRVRFGTLTESPSRHDWIALGDEELCRALAMEDAIQPFHRGALLTTQVLEPNAASIAAPVISTWRDGHSIPYADFHYLRTKQPVSSPVYLIGIDSKLGQAVQPGPPPNRSLVPWIVRFPQPIDAFLVDSIRQIASHYPSTIVDSQAVESGSLRYTFLAALVCSILLGMIVVLTSLALSFAESANEFRVLCTIGAASYQLRSLVAIRAGYLAGIGCLLAVPCGMVVASSLFGAINFEMRWVFPWKDIAIIVVATPSIIAFCAGVFLRPWSNLTFVPKGFP